jgi:hypothetical protein
MLIFSVYPAIDPQSAYEAQIYKGKSVLITGGSRGIGAETALHYAKCGASLALTGRREDVLEETKQTILQSAPDADIYLVTADVSDEPSMRKAVQGTLDRFGKLDIVIQNAGWSVSWDKRGFYVVQILLSLSPSHTLCCSYDRNQPRGLHENLPDQRSWPTYHCVVSPTSTSLVLLPTY